MSSTSQETLVSPAIPETENEPYSSVSTSFSQTETDKDGKYTFVGLNGSVVVSVEKEGYQFETSNKLVKNE
ncbi:MAG: hypothetical protein J6A51_02620, partial [Clostridia bacterium]|nr:hypothetical protein [Clostridia bacterium]